MYHNVTSEYIVSPEGGGVERDASYYKLIALLICYKTRRDASIRGDMPRY